MEINQNIVWFSYLILVLLSFIGFIIPFLTKKTILFGSRLPKELLDYSELKNLKRNFKYLYSIIEIPYLILAAIFILNFSVEFFFTVVVFLQIILMLFIYAVFNKRTKEIKKNILERDEIKTGKETKIVDTTFREGKYTVSIKWFIPSISAIIINIFLLLINYDKIPAQIISHLNISGEVTQMFDKSLIHVMTIPITSLIILLVFILVYFSIKRSKQEIDSTAPETSKYRDKYFRNIWSYYLVIVSTLLMIWMLFLSLHQNKLLTIPSNIFSILNIAIPITVLLGAIILAVKVGQSGSRLKLKTEESESFMNNVDDDNYWKLGMFYYNPSDPSIFVEKRYGIGWTINFGRPIDMGIIAAIFIIILVSIIFR